MKVTVYTKRNCVQCRATERALTDAGVSFEEVSLDDTPEALQLAKDMGFMQAPVVVVSRGRDVHSWSGFRPDLLGRLAVETGGRREGE